MRNQRKVCIKRLIPPFAGGLVALVLIWLTLAVEARPGFQGAETPLLISYQGYLTQDGQPITTTLPITFTLYDAPTDGNLLWQETGKAVEVQNGLFVTYLGDQTSLDRSLFTHNALWLGVQVAGRPEMSPRQRLVSSPYAIGAGDADTLDGLDSSAFGDITAVYAGTGLTGSGTTGAVTLTLDTGYVDNRYWKLSGNAVDGLPGSQFLGTTDEVTLTLKVSGTTALRLVPTTGTPNVIGGYEENSVTAGVVGATIAGGGADTTGGNTVLNRVTDNYGTVSGGWGNQAGDDAGTTSDKKFATVGGGRYNTAGGYISVVGGGGNNIADNYAATVAGGVYNTASGDTATVGGGGDNVASGIEATVGGGGGNTASGTDATVSGGYGNEAAGTGATVGGGGRNETGTGSNRALATASTIAGGYGNVIPTTASYAAIGGGRDNEAAGAGAAVGGGGYDGTNFGGNRALAPASTIAGGIGNVITTTASYAAVSGGYGNEAAGAGAAVGGGGYDGTNFGGNRALASASTIAGGMNNYITSTASYATVGGGHNNTANSPNATVSGGLNNTASGPNATVGGGYNNTAAGQYTTVGGGWDNTNNGNYATVSGGRSNTAGGWNATVGGGHSNTASGDQAIVSGGAYNTASSYYATVGGGYNNTASGWYATVPGGAYNTASGDYSFAAGRRAQANADGCFVWADSTDADVSCNNDDRTIFRSSGGFYIYTRSDLSSGVYVPAGGGAWSTVSDRELKENFAQVDEQELLARLAEIPITTWNYKSQDDAIRHIGPMAQDFYAAFGVGEDDRHISTIDADGVALAAIQGLYRQSQEQAIRIETLEREKTALQEEVNTMRAENESLRRRLDNVEARLAAMEDNTPAGGSESSLLPGAGLLLIGLLWMTRRK